MVQLQVGTGVRNIEIRNAPPTNFLSSPFKFNSNLFQLPAFLVAAGIYRSPIDIYLNTFNHQPIPKKEMQLKTILLPLLPFLLPIAAAADPEVTTEYLVTQTCSRKTTRGDTISVHYRGTLAADGSEFDASYNRNQPLKFTVGKGQVIKGWDEGLLDMCIGDQRKLTIPSEFGYGARGMGPIPGGATLSTYGFSFLCCCLVFCLSSF